MSRHTYKYALLILSAIVILPNLVTCRYVSARELGGAFYSGIVDTDSTPATVGPSKSETNQRLQHIENDLKSLKIFGPLLIYLLSDSKRWYKLLIVMMMYFFLVTFYYRKGRRSGETKINNDTEAATDSKAQETPAVHSADFCAVDIPASSEMKGVN